MDLLHGAFEGCEWEAPLIDPILRFLSLDWPSIKKLADSDLERSHKIWAQIQAITQNRQRREEFKSTLSASQKTSWALLDNWWNSRYSLHPVPKTYDLFSEMMNVERGRRKGPKTITGRALDYNGALCFLFLLEFKNWKENIDLESFVELRADANQRFSFFRDQLSYERNFAMQYASWQRIAISYIRQRNPQAPASAISTASLRSTWLPCPWLDHTPHRKRRLPLYLWDRIEKRTIRTSELKIKNPQYYCISHTWGRWENGSTYIEGVSGWEVPTNTQFDVRNLPRRFSSLDWPVRYIWFDLFCIPQTEGSPEKAEEIGKQADIFQNAANCVIYMHDITSWERLRAAVIWLALAELVDSQPHVPNEAIASFIAAHLQAQELSLIDKEDPWAIPGPGIPLLSHRVTAQGMTFSGCGSIWLSSLWTLQEAYLCPSAFLVNREWEFLSMDSGMRLSLDNVVSLMTLSAVRTMKSNRQPPIVSYLTELICGIWQFHNFQDAGQVLLLAAGERRSCTKNRAEAIMAAVGATDWYESYRRDTGLAHPQRDVIMNLYSLDFVREAALKIGAAFWLDRRNPEPGIDHARIGKPIGSLLPFAYSPDMIYQHRIVYTRGGGRAGYWRHCLAGSWEIQIDGSVRIKQAAILGSTVHSPSLNEEADGHVEIMTYSKRAEFPGGFKDWIKSSSSQHNSYRFAVAVASDMGQALWGVTLEGIEDPVSTQGELHLVKTGIFFIHGTRCWADQLKLQSVNWLVL